MRQLELLAPARDIQVGIAAIDCGADAVYIAGPQFGARQAAGNSIDDIRNLCTYAHRFGARIFVALNTILYDDELEPAYRQMLEVQDAGADALIIQDLGIIEMVLNKGIGNIRSDFRIPLHASTQCAIRTPGQAAFLEGLGFSRLILERELSLEQIRAIRDAVTCELEFFVHGALCVCYSGQCYLSEMIAGRSANRGACIQACRSRYDLADAKGRILVKDKALLSLKDYNLKARIEELADAGITSFKIEGRLKNASYVRNVVRDYSLALDRIVERRGKEYERGSSGSVSCGFTPDTEKTFNRGYTELYLDGKRGHWAAMDAAKSMGEEVGEIITLNKERTLMTIRPLKKGLTLNNGDGFSFVARDGKIAGFRGDRCDGFTISSKAVPEAFTGARLYRNMNVSFEKELERQACIRTLDVAVEMSFIRDNDLWKVKVSATSEDGRKIDAIYEASDQTANNRERMTEMIISQIGKTALHYRFRISGMKEEGDIPFMSASVLNAIRRDLADRLENLPCVKKDILLRKAGGSKTTRKPFPQKNATYKNNISNLLSEKVHHSCGAVVTDPAYELSHTPDAELMRTRYCIRYELGICPRYHGCKDSGALFLVNNGRRLSLGFDCRNCEMTVKEDRSQQSQK